MDWLSLALFVASAVYLVGRVFIQIRRQQMSYDKLPFPVGGWRPDFGSPERDRGAGALVGIAVGDALGAPRESLPVWLCNARYGRKPALSRGVVRFMRRRGTVTDDTQQTWLVAQATEDGVFDVDAFRVSLLDWFDWRIGPGRGTEAAIRAIQRGGDVATSSQGNGAAMRVAPLAVAFRDDEEGLAAAVAASASVTHPNPEATRGAQLVAEITRCLLVDAPLPTEDDSAEWTRVLTSPQRVTPTGWIFDTVECALALFGKHGGEWEEALTDLFTLGGDTDTVGAIYCSWVGAKHGASHFGEIVGRVQGAELLVESSQALAPERSAWQPPHNTPAAAAQARAQRF